MLASSGHPVVVLFCSVHARCTASTRGAGMTRDTLQAAGQPHERVRTARQSGGQPSRRQTADPSCTRHRCPQPHSDGWLRNARRRAGCSAARRRRHWGRAAPLRRRARRPAHTHLAVRLDRRGRPRTRKIPCISLRQTQQHQRKVGGMEAEGDHAAVACLRLPCSPHRERGPARASPAATRQPCRFPTLQK